MDRLIETVASGTGNAIAAAAESGLLLGLFAVLWLAFGAALLMGHGTLDAAWAWITSLPWPVQGLLWLLFLPVMAGLWVWESSWPILARLVLIGGLAGWNLLVLLPRALTGRP